MVRLSAWWGSKSVDATTICVAFFPVTGIQDFDCVATRGGCFCQLGPGVFPITVQAQGSAHEHDPAVTHCFNVFTRDVIGQGNGRIARVGLGFTYQSPTPRAP